MVQNRYFFHAAGFDPSGLAARHRGFCREAARFASTWNVTAAVSGLREPDAEHGHWTMMTSGPGWRVRASFECLDWSDIVRADLARPLPVRMWQATGAFIDFVGSGTAWRYFAAHWKYGMFFLVPFLDAVLFAALAIAAGGYVAFASPSGFLGAIAAALVTPFGFALLMRWPGRRWGVGQALADWVFAREYMRHLRPDVDARIDAFARRLAACASRPDIDEIVITGHSLGATVVLDAVSRALGHDPQFGRRGAPVCILTIGATIPKLALHPKGEWLRAKAQRIAAEARLAWAEYQARDDVISFYRFDPVKLCRIVEGGERPLVRRVQIYDMLGKATARRMRFRFMRRHYQFVMANERRTIYDYFMLIGGPAPFRHTIRQANGPADLYGADGSLNEFLGAIPQKSPGPQ